MSRSLNDFLDHLGFAPVEPGRPTERGPLPVQTSDLTIIGLDPKPYLVITGDRAVWLIGPTEEPFCLYDPDGLDNDE